MQDVVFVSANVQQSKFACVCCIVTLILVGTCEMKIDLSLYNFCKDTILLILIYWYYKIFVHLPNNSTCKQIGRHGTNIEKTTQDNNFSKFIYRNCHKLIQ